MREIKFRLWSSNQFSYWGFIKDYWGHLLFAGITTTGEPLSMKELLNRSQQFTGLQDKQDKEIWEGDIVKSKSIVGEEFVGRVFYADSQAAFLLSVKNKYGVMIALDPISWLYAMDESDDVIGEVIGNIYENPELLEAK